MIFFIVKSNKKRIFGDWPEPETRPRAETASNATNMSRTVWICSALKL